MHLCIVPCGHEVCFSNGLSGRILPDYSPGIILKAEMICPNAQCHPEMSGRYVYCILLGTMNPHRPLLSEETGPNSIPAAYVCHSKGVIWMYTDCLVC